ncbi:MAG: radical SAM protein [Bdellovibrionota bacterium]
MTQVSSLYLHVPFCKHLCNYCDFYKTKLDSSKNQIEEFHQFLRESWDRHQLLMSEKNFSWGPLETVYLGGGTPSLWGTRGAEFFHEFFLKKLSLNSPEFTMEIDPGTWSEDGIESWKRNGLNRISIGTQTLDPKFLKIMDRVHSLEETFSLLKYCKDGNWNFSLDFLLGIPHSQNEKRDIKNELEELLKYRPKHISLYILNARSKYPLVEHIPDDEYVREEYLLVSQFLQEKGFHHYEVSNFASPGFESRHNMKYWKGESVAALGPTGAGYFSQANNEAFRYTWKVMNPEIQPEILGKSELSLERIYLTLRTSAGWEPEQITPELKAIFDQWESQHYGQFQVQKMVLNSLGFVMLDSLMDDLFRKGLA